MISRRIATHWLALTCLANCSKSSSFGNLVVLRPEAAGRGKARDLHILGFTHYCGQRHKSGTFTVWRITAKARMVAQLKAIKVELRRRMHDRMAEVGAWLRKVVLGYYQYHAVPGNTTQLRIFKLRVCRLWQSVLVRRSQRAKMRGIVLGSDS